MLKFFIGLLLGGVLGVCTMCILFAGKAEDEALGINDLTANTDNTEGK